MVKKLIYLNYIILLFRYIMIDPKFDWKYYINKYPDLIQNNIDTEQKAILHWNIHGKNEGRIFCPINKNFDWKFYINKYQDLKEINTEEKAWYHWIVYGNKEGRLYKKNIKIAIIYIGAYNYFDYTFKTQKENLFDILDQLNIKYDIFANIESIIEFRTDSFINTDKNIAKNYIETFYLTKPELAQHLPDDYEKQLEFKTYGYSNDSKVSKEDEKFNPYIINANKLLLENSNYCYDKFKSIFKDNCKLIFCEPQVDNLKKKLMTNIHNAKYFFDSIIYIRNLYTKNKIRQYEIENNINYDLIITLRPDIEIQNEFKKQIKKIINDVENNIFNNFSGEFELDEARIDFLFISKYFLSELINIDISLKEDELNSDIYYFDGINGPKTEKFIKNYLNTIKLYCNKFL